MLNREQQKAVTITEGPVRIIAGPGAGKTITLISRITYLIKEKGVKPGKILILMPTTQSAHMVNRSILNEGLPSVPAMTFPMLAVSTLRRLSDTAFRIITPKETEDMLDAILDKNEKPEKEEVIKSCDNIRHKSQRQLNTTSLSDGRIHEILMEYRKMLAEKRGLDQTGLLSTLVELWKEKPTAAIASQNQFQYVLVDDYHDLSPLQISIVSSLCKAHENCCVVGDADQTISSYLGARPDTMTFFERNHPSATSVSLIKNYRNPESLIKGSENLISNNVGRLKKPNQPTKQEKEMVKIYRATDEQDQFSMISKIVSENSKSYSLSDIAIICRNLDAKKALSDHLAKLGMPCQMAHHSYFWGKQVIIDFLEGIESLSQWTNISNDQKFSHWINDKVQKFITAHQFNDKTKNVLRGIVRIAKMTDHLPTKKALNVFLDECRTYQPADNLALNNRINVMDFHSIKGLEFPIVIFNGLEEDSLPHHRLKNEPYWLAEERRTFYVGLTRSSSQVHIVTNKENGEPSRFLAEMGEDCLKKGRLPDITISEVNVSESKKAQLEMF